MKEIIADSVFYKRQSPRRFTNEDVKQEVLFKLFEAARWAPSSFNEQPWRFIYAIKSKPQDEHVYKNLLACLYEENQKWAAEAPVLMLSMAKTHFTKNGKANRHAWHDLGQAIANFSIQATLMNLIVHQMAGFSRQEATKKFNLPERLEPVAMVTIGYPAEKKRNRNRKPINKLILDV